MTNYTTTADKILEAPKQAKKALYDAIEALEAFKSKKADAFTGKAADYKKQLQQLESEIDVKTSELAEAVVAGNDKAITRLEGEISQLTSKAEPLRKIVGKLDADKAKYMHTEEGEKLLRAVLEAWDALISAQIRAKKELGEVVDKGKAELAALKKAIEDVDNRRFKASEMRDIDGYVHYTEEGRRVAQIVSFYEERFGEIDVAGHTAGDDIEAKTRYIRRGGSAPGLDRTAVAGTVQPHLAGSGGK